MEDRKSDELTLPEVLAWGETWCWMVLVLTPIIWWLQGPSVSTDQFIVRTALVVLAAAGGIGLRTRAWIRRPLQSAGRPTDPASPPPGQEAPR
jgi:hypothetical protein